MLAVRLSLCKKDAAQPCGNPWFGSVIQNGPDTSSSSGPAAENRRWSVEWSSTGRTRAGDRSGTAGPPRPPAAPARTGERSDPPRSVPAVWIPAADRRDGLSWDRDFSSVQDAFRKKLRSGGPQQALFLSAQLPQGWRHVVQVFRNAPVAEGHPDLQGVPHAHAVLAVQQRLHEPFEIQVHHLAHPLFCGRAGRGGRRSVPAWRDSVHPRTLPGRCRPAHPGLMNDAR